MQMDELRHGAEFVAEEDHVEHERQEQGEVLYVFWGVFVGRQQRLGTYINKGVKAGIQLVFVIAPRLVLRLRLLGLVLLLLCLAL